MKAVALTAAPTVPTHDVDLPRMAVYSTWGSTQEVGWVRYAFDQFELPYDLIYKDRVRKGNLRAPYDVIVIPNQGRAAKGLVYDIEPRTGKAPLAYTKSDQFKNLGMYGESDDITGGMGLEGVVEFRKFVDAGGVLITLGTASAFPAEFGITRRVEAGAHLAGILRAGSDRAGGNSAPRESDFLRIYREDDPGALGQRPAIDRSGTRSGAAGADAFPRRRRGRDERPDARRERDPRTSRGARRSGRAKAGW